MLTNCEKTTKSIAGAVLSDQKSLTTVAELSSKIEDARINNPSKVKRLQGDLESFVMSRVSENPAYRLDLIKRLKAKDQPIEMLKLINDSGELVDEVVSVANKFGVPKDEALDAISRKIMRDHMYAKQNGYDQFMKRFNKDSKLDSLRDDQIDDFIQNEYEQDYINKVGAESLAKAKAKEVSGIQKSRGVSAKTAKEIVEQQFKDGLTKFMFRGDEAIKGFQDLTPSQANKLLKISSFINKYDDVKQLTNPSTIEDVSEGIKYITNTSELDSFVISNYDKLSKDDLLELYKKHVELGFDVSQRQKFFLRGSLIGKIEGEILELRARTLGMDDARAAKLNHVNAVKALEDILQRGEYSANGFDIKYLDGAGKEFKVRIDSTEQLFKLMGFENLVRADTNFEKILNKAPGLRENIFGKAVDEFVESSIVSNIENKSEIFNEYGEYTEFAFDKVNKEIMQMSPKEIEKKAKEMINYERDFVKNNLSDTDFKRLKEVQSEIDSYDTVLPDTNQLRVEEKEILSSLPESSIYNVYDSEERANILDNIEYFKGISKKSDLDLYKKISDASLSKGDSMLNINSQPTDFMLVDESVRQLSSRGKSIEDILNGIREYFIKSGEPEYYTNEVMTSFAEKLRSGLRKRKTLDTSDFKLKDNKVSDQPKIISPIIKDFFKITEDVTDNNKAFNRFFGTDPKNSKFLNISYDISEGAAESKYIAAQYERNSSLIGEVGSVSTVEEAIELLQKENAEIKTIIVQSQKQKDLFPKSLQNQVVFPKGYTNNNYFVKDGNLYVGSRNAKFKKQMDQRIGSIRGDLITAADDGDVLNALEALADESNMPVEKFRELLRAYGKGDEFKGYEVLSNYKKSGYGRSAKYTNFEDKYNEILGLEDTDLADEVRRILRKNGTEWKGKVTEENKAALVDGVMGWKYPEGNPNAQQLVFAAGLSEVPTANKAILKGKLYELVITKDEAFTEAVLDDIVEDYVKTGKVNTSKLEFSSDELQTEVESLFKSIQDQKAIPIKKEGEGVSITEVSDMFMDDVELSVTLLSNTESGKKLATLLRNAPVETVDAYKSEILTQYKALWNKYEAELGNSILNKQSLARQEEIRESFMVAMREFDDQVVKGELGAFVDIHNVTGLKYSVYKISKESDLPTFVKMKDDAIERLKNKLDAAGDAVRGSEGLKGDVSPNSIDNQFARNIERAPKSERLDEVSNQWDQLPAEARVQLNDAIVKINEVYDYHANELVRYYEIVNKSMVDFFQEYKLVDTLNGFKLPKKLAENIRIPVREGIDTNFVDASIKRSILEDISNAFNKEQLTISSLNDIIESSILKHGGSIDDLPLYASDFSPYINLTKIPEGVRDLIDAKRGMKKPIVSDEMMDKIGDVPVITANGKFTISDLINKEPETKMPEVMYGSNKLQKVEPEYKIQEVEVFNDRMRNLDEIEKQSIQSLDENGLAVNGRFLQRQEDFLRQLGSPKINAMLDMDISLTQLGISAQASIDSILGWRTTGGTFRRALRTGKLSKSADFGRVSGILDDFMNMSDKEFDSFLGKTRNTEQDAALGLAQYFREWRKRMLSIVDDPQLVENINTIHRHAFQSSKGKEAALVRLKEQIGENRPFGMMKLDEKIIPGVNLKHGFYSFEGYVAETRERFNEIFGTNIQSKGDILRIFESFGHAPSVWGNISVAANPTRILTNFGFTQVGRVLSSIKTAYRYATGFIGGTFVQFLPQIGAYVVKDVAARKWMGLGEDEFAKLIAFMQFYKMNETIGSAMSFKQRESISKLMEASRKSGVPISDIYSPGLSAAKIDQLVATISSIGGGAGNFNDAIFALNIYAKHVQGAFKTLKQDGYFFSSVDDFLKSQKYMSQRQVDDVIEKIKAKAQRTYKEEVGNVNRAQDRLLSSFRNDAFNFYSSFLSKVGRGNNTVASTYKNWRKLGNTITYALTNSSNIGKNVDDIVNMISDDFAFQNFLVNEVSTAYMAAKFAKVYDADTQSEDEEDAYGMATEMRKYLSFGNQGLMSSSLGRLFSDVSPRKDEEMDVVGIGYGKAKLAKILDNFTKGVGAQYTILKFIPKFIEGYNLEGEEGGIKASVKFLGDMSKAGLRYMYEQAVSDKGVMLDSSEIGTRSKIFFQNDTYARKDQQKMANIKLYSDWMKMTTDYAKKDPDFEYYYFDQDGKELSPLKRTGNLMSYIVGRGAFRSVLDKSNASTSRGLAKKLSQNPLLKEYSTNGYIDISSLDLDSKREYSKMVAADLFGNQKLGGYSEGESVTSAGVYSTLENFLLGDKIAIKNKSMLALLESLPENDVRDMLTQIGDANTENKRMAVEVDIMNRYKTNPRMAQFFISAIAEREYLTTKKAINEQYKKLNKGQGTENDVKITYAQDQYLRDTVVEKYSKQLQLSNREYGTSLLYSAIIATESRKEDSDLKGFVQVVKDKNDNIVYDITDKNFLGTAGQLIDLERARRAGISNPGLATQNPLAQTIKYIPDDNKIAFLKHADKMVESNPNLSEQEKIEQRVGLLNADPSLVDKGDEVKNIFGEQVWDTYVGLRYGLYQDMDDIMNTYMESAVSDSLNGTGAGKSGGVSGGRVETPKNINFKLPQVDFKKFQEIVQSKGFNSTGKSLKILDDQFKISASALSKMGNEKPKLISGPLGNISAQSNVYFKDTGGKTQSTSKRTKFTTPKKKLLKTKK